MTIYQVIPGIIASFVLRTKTMMINKTRKCSALVQLTLWLGGTEQETFNKLFKIRDLI